MRTLSISTIAVLSLLLAATPDALSGQTVREVTCESRNDRTQTCDVRAMNERTVRLVRQISGSPCVKDRTWGTSDDGIWVTNGCRAVFSYEESGYGYGDGDYDGRVTCESENNRRKTCRITNLDQTSVRLARQLSSSDCVNGRTWGTNRDQIWVTGGCRADFTYDTRRGSGGSSGDSGRQRLTCESRGGDLRNCRVDGLNERSVRLERQLSSAACVNGRTWGTQPGMIWVESGCRAQFSYTTGGGSGWSGTDSGRQRLTCESRGGDLRNCRVDGLIENSVRLERRLSSAACVNGRTWGTQPGLIWVESGCRAEFSYQRR